MAFRLLHVAILSGIILKVASGSSQGNFPLTDCLEDDTDMLVLLEYDRDQTWLRQRTLMDDFHFMLSELEPSGSSSGWMTAKVLDKFSAHNANIDVSEWSFSLLFSHHFENRYYGDWETENLEISVNNISTVLGLKIQFVERLFKEMSRDRKDANQVGVIILDGAALTQEEIRNVPSIVQQRNTNTDVKIFVMIFGNKLVEDLVHLTDTIVLPTNDVSNFAQHLLMAMCNKCAVDWIAFEHQSSNDILSCYLLEYIWLKGVPSAVSFCNSVYNGFLAGIETEEEMTFLQKYLIEENKDYSSNTIQINIGLQRDLSNYAKRFKWVTTPGRYHPLLIQHWLPGKPSGGCMSADCGVWRFTRSLTHELNRSNLSQNITSDTGDFVEGWADVECSSQLSLLTLCEVVLPQTVNAVDGISIIPASKRSFKSALKRGNFETFHGNIKSVSANVANREFLQFLKHSKRDFPIFDCGENSGDRRYISYNMVCDFVVHCSNRHDEMFCSNPREIFWPKENYCSSGQRLQGSQYRCDNVKDCIDGSDEEKCNAHTCKSIRCYDGSCLPLQWINDGEFDCFMCKNNSVCDVNDESSHANTYLPNNKNCALICNRDTCIDVSQLNDTVINCIGPEGPLDETIGTLERANTCTNSLGDFIWAPKCHYIKDRYGGTIGCRDMSHLIDCENFECRHGYVKCYNSYCIPQHYLLDGIADCPTGNDEQPLYIGQCAGHFACWDSDVCLHPDLVCDGHPDCPQHDDERDCHEVCPTGVRCIAGTVRSSVYKRSGYLHNLNNSALDKRTRYLDLSRVKRLNFDTFITANKEIFVNLKVLILSKCGISQLYLPQPDIDTRNVLSSMIQKLDISYNKIVEIFSNERYSKYYNNINYLNVSYNKQLVVVKNLRFMFLEIMDLSYTSISYLNDSVFVWLTALKHVNLSHTLISDFSRRFFPTTLTLQTLDLRGILTTDFYDYFFHGLTVSQSLYTDQFQICCPQVKGLTIQLHSCIAPVDVDAISSCSNLLGLSVQRVLLWMVAVFAVLGNIMVIVYRLIWDRSVLKTGYGLYVTNLGISDFIMGVYLFIIAGADYFYRGDYVLYDEKWRDSDVCKFAGFMACLSCEASTFFVFLITLDRFLVMKFPFGQNKCSGLIKTMAVTLSWVISVVLSLVPIVFYFDIYSSNAMCLGLPLTNKQGKGWEYSVGVFIIYNFIMFLFIAYGQYAIFRAMSENRISKTATSMSCSRRAQEIVVAKQLSLVVVSNFLFWFPVGLIGLLSLGGHEVSNEVYAWTTVLLLPINSAVNPVLYTIPALMARWERFKYGHQSAS